MLRGAKRVWQRPGSVGKFVGGSGYYLLKALSLCNADGRKVDNFQNKKANGGWNIGLFEKRVSNFPVQNSQNNTKHSFLGEYNEQITHGFSRQSKSLIKSKLSEASRASIIRGVLIKLFYWLETKDVFVCSWNGHNWCVHRRTWLHLGCTHRPCAPLQKVCPSKPTWQKETFSWPCVLLPILSS